MFAIKKQMMNNENLHWEEDNAKMIGSYDHLNSFPMEKIYTKNVNMVVEKKPIEDVEASDSSDDDEMLVDDEHYRPSKPSNNNAPRSKTTVQIKSKAWTRDTINSAPTYKNPNFNKDKPQVVKAPKEDNAVFEDEDVEDDVKEEVKAFVQQTILKTPSPLVKSQKNSNSNQNTITEVKKKRSAVAPPQVVEKEETVKKQKTSKSQAKPAAVVKKKKGPFIVRFICDKAHEYDDDMELDNGAPNDLESFQRTFYEQISAAYSIKGAQAKELKQMVYNINQMPESGDVIDFSNREEFFTG